MIESLFLFFLASFFEGSLISSELENINVSFSDGTGSNLGILGRKAENPTLNSFLQNKDISLILHNNCDPLFNRDDSTGYKKINNVDKSKIKNFINVNKTSTSYATLNWKYTNETLRKLSNDIVQPDNTEKESFYYITKTDDSSVEAFNFSNVLFFLSIPVSNENEHYELEIPLLEIEPDMDYFLSADLNETRYKTLVSPLGLTEVPTIEVGAEETLVKYKLSEKKYRYGIDLSSNIVNNSLIKNYLFTENSVLNLIGNIKSSAGTIPQNAYYLASFLYSEFFLFFNSLKIPNFSNEFLTTNSEGNLTEISLFSKIVTDVYWFTKIAFTKELITSYTPVLKKDEKLKAGEKEVI